MSEKWTDEQLAAIENTTGNMIVSASAGSGKTAVMIERVRRLVVDKKVPVSRILMLSFNEAIAVEIKEKMAKVLIEEIKKGGDEEFLQEQIDSIGMCDITTMHSFCNSLVKEYFDIVGVDPSYSIMDENESDVVINKAINEVFEKYLEDKDSAFILLQDKLTEHNECKLRELIRKIFSFSNALLSSDKWLENAHIKNYGTELKNAKAVKLIIDELINRVNDTYDALELAVNSVDNEKFPEAMNALNFLVKYVGEENITAYESFIKLEPDIKFRSPRSAAGAEEYNIAKNEYKSLCAYIHDLFKVSYARMAEDHRQDGVMVAKLFEVVKLFKSYYQREKKEVNKLDFNDLEHYAVEILSHEEIRQETKSKYDYVCVDEYQDTNEVQDNLLAAVSRGDNLFMVGDPKQSIYKFRFTEPELFVDKLQKYSISEDDFAVQLSKNFRSSPLILDRVNNVFDILMREKKAGKIREAYRSLENGQDFIDNIEEPFSIMLYEMGNSKKGVITEPHTYRVSEESGVNTEAKAARVEADYIAGKVKELLTKKIYDIKSGEYRDVKFDDMVILSSSRSESIRAMLEILENTYKLPIDSSNLKKSDEPQEVKILIDFLRIIDNPRQDIQLYEVMKLFWGFTDGDFVAMKREAGKTDHFFDIVFGDIIENSEMIGKLNTFKAQLEEYRTMSSFMNVHDFLISVIERTEFKRKLMMCNNGAGACDNIDKFILSLKDKKHASNVQEFLYAYDNYAIDNSVDATSQSLNSCIHTSTIHKSKGLEYPIVFIADIGSEFIHRGTKTQYYMLDKEYGFAMRTFDERNKTVYSNWLLKAIIAKEIREETEEKMRLLYVAMTRAKNCLYMVGKIPSGKKDLDDMIRFSEWLYEIGERNSEFKEHIDYRVLNPDDYNEVVSSDKLRAFEYKPYSESEAEHYREVFDYEYPYMDATSLAEKYTVTAINHEEREQEEYVPELYETKKTSVGSIYHKFMECVNYEADTIEAIKAEMDRMVRENILTEDEISNICIEDVYKCLNSSIIKKAKVNRHEREKKFMMHLPLSTVKEGASDEYVLVQGIADLIIYGKENILVDFKKSSLPDNLLRESYKKQLEIYKFALERSMNIKIDKTCLYVIGADRIIDID